MSGELIIQGVSAGRVQLPREYRETLQLVGRVRLALESSHVSVWPGVRTPRHAATTSTHSPGSPGSAGSVEPRARDGLPVPGDTTEETR